MARRLVLALTIALLLSGCAAVAEPPAASSPAATGGLLASGAALWDDPQNAPHPAWGWPTLTHPASGANAPAWWAPVPAAPMPASIAGLAHAGRKPTGMGDGAGIAVFGSLVVVPGFGDPTHVVDLRDPERPMTLSTILSDDTHRGAAFVAYPDGRLAVVISTDSTIEVWNVTDPADPTPFPTLLPSGGSHKVGVVPGTPIVWNANSRGAGAAISIFDLTDPDAPVLVQNFRGGYGCHHVYFWVMEEKQRAICAGEAVTQILDIADPRDPEVIVNVPFAHGMRGAPSVATSPAHFSHFSILDRTGTILIAGDEMGGGALAACDVHAEAAGKSVSGAGGNLYFYDVTVETQPKLLGWFNPGAHFTRNLMPAAGCTAHHGRLVPDPERERALLAMAWYGNGVVLVDFTDPEDPKLAAQWAQRTNTWEAWYVNGWIVTGDLARGMDVLRFA